MAAKFVILVTLWSLYIFIPSTSGSSIGRETKVSVEEQIDTGLKITLLISPPDVRAAIELLKNKTDVLIKFVESASHNISSDSKSIIDILDTFLVNLKEKVNDAGEELQENVKQQISEAIDKIRAFLTKERALLNNLIVQVQQQVSQSLEEIQAKVESITKFIQSGLKNLSIALNESQSFILPIIRKELNSAIVVLNNTLSNPQVQGAIVKFVVSQLQGPAVLTLTNVLTGLSTALLATGNPLLAAVAASIPALVAYLPAIMGPILSTTVTLGLGLLLG